MPKHDFLTPKAIANRIKSKGLQKLKWYCQMCQKQCRDENGFKCHTTSESHQRQLLLFADNPNRYLDYFSEEFMTDFVELLSRRFGTRRVSCNVVYQEYIGFKEHTHMNSTKWETLTQFVKWLGREGHCVVDETPKGWFMSYIERDADSIQKQEEKRKKEKMDLDDEERIQKHVKKQVEKASHQGPSEAVFTGLQRCHDNDKVQFNMSQNKLTDTLKTTAPVTLHKNPLSVQQTDQRTEKPKKDRKRKMTALEEIVQAEKKRKPTPTKIYDNWLMKGIVVKLLTTKLGERYHKKKGVITDVLDKYTGVIKMTVTGVKVKVDQEHLETVIPALGRQVLIVNHVGRGCRAVLISLNEKRFSASVKILDGSKRGEILDNVKYEYFSKLDVETS